MLFTKVLQIGRPGQCKTRAQLIQEYKKARKETTDILELSYIDNRIEKLQADQKRNNEALERDIKAGVFN